MIQERKMLFWEISIFLSYIIIRDELRQNLNGIEQSEISKIAVKDIWENGLSPKKWRIAPVLPQSIKGVASCPEGIWCLQKTSSWKWTFNTSIYVFFSPCHFLLSGLTKQWRLFLLFLIILFGMCRLPLSPSKKMRYFVQRSNHSLPK